MSTIGVPAPMMMLWFSLPISFVPPPKLASHQTTHTFLFFFLLFSNQPYLVLFLPPHSFRANNNYPMTHRLNLFRRGNSEARELRKQKRDEFLAKKKNQGLSVAAAAAEVPVAEVKELVPEPTPIVENVTDNDEASPNNSAVEEDEERDGAEPFATEESEQLKDESRTTVDESPAVSSTGLLCGCL
jgi:hypothetical protein